MQTRADDRLAKLGWTERIGYGLGDAGFNLYWAIIGSYLAFFYTDVFGLPAAAAATLLTVTKIIDAVTDPAMGAIADRTSTPWGKFRPYLLAGVLPMMGAGILAMTTPALSDGGKLAWAYATYSLLMLTYTVLNTPYNSLSAVLTADPDERSLLNSVRFFFAYLTSILVGSATPGVVRYFGGGDLYEPSGWRMTITLYGALASILIATTFFATKERVSPSTEVSGSPIRDIKNLMGSRPWLILFAVALAFMMTMTVRSASSAYYFRYFVQRTDLLGAYLGLQFAGLMVGAASAAYVARVIDKKNLLVGALVVVCVLSSLMALVPKSERAGVVATAELKQMALNAEELLVEPVGAGEQFEWFRREPMFWIFSRRVSIATGPTLDVSSMRNEVISVVRKEPNGQITDSAALAPGLLVLFGLNILISIALGFKAPITWAMYGDVADYTEWRYGRRATAMTFSATTFSQKLGGAAGSALLLFALASMGYQSGETQSAASLNGIVYLQTIVPGLFALVTAVILFFYQLDEAMLVKIQADLSERKIQM